MKEPPTWAVFSLISLRITAVHDAAIEGIHAPEWNEGPKESLTTLDLLHDHLSAAVVDYSDELIVGNRRVHLLPVAMALAPNWNLRFPDSL